MKLLFVLCLPCLILANANIVGKWQMKCTQTQTQERSGYLIESYHFFKDARFKQTKSWYKDAKCREKEQSQKFEGKYVLGAKETNNGFNPAGTVKATFTVKEKSDRGVIWVKADKLRLSRGLGTMENKMLGLFEYSKR